jgi:hypothetical protein
MNFLQEVLNEQFKPTINFNAEEKKIQKYNNYYDRLRKVRDELYLINEQKKALILAARIDEIVKE